VLHTAAWACAWLSLFGLVQAVVGWLLVRRFLRRKAEAAYPSVSVLKPLHGDEPLLEAALASLCAQDYPAFQVVFGLQDRGDPALAVVERLRARFPTVDMAVVIDPTPHGTNRKVANLINMLPLARYDILIIADSDVHAAPDYLARLAAAVQAPGLGLVTTLYTGLPASGTLVRRLGAAWINNTFLPGALLARAMGRQDCLGATMALSRATLERIGGFPALSDQLADDAMLGRRVRAEGLEVALAGTIPATTIPETRLLDLFRHELRWARTVKSLEPTGFALSVLQYPLFWAALGVVLAGFAPGAWGLFALAWFARGLVAHGLDRDLQVEFPLTIWCLPLRDLLSVAVMLASYGSDQVTWRGHMHHVSGPALSRTGLAPGEG
jgi:ceramide glucosyltransferase